MQTSACISPIYGNAALALGFQWNTITERSKLVSKSEILTVMATIIVLSGSGRLCKRQQMRPP
jgi:hypothetical protein